jgi:hypothetical protein
MLNSDLVLLAGLEPASSRTFGGELMRRHLIRVAVLVTLSVPFGRAATVAWTDWTSATAGASGSGSGTLNVSGETVNVSYSGEIFFAQTSGAGTNYWNPNTAYLSSAVENAPPDSDIIALIGPSTLNTISFSVPVADPVLAILSLGRPSIGTDYVFDAPFTIVSNGPGFWGNGPLTNIGGNTLRGNEGHGVIQFSGTFSSISWSVPLAENWHGFQVGVVGLDDGPNGEIPEPGTIGLALAGLALLAVRRRLRA